MTREEKRKESLRKKYALLQQRIREDTDEMQRVQTELKEVETVRLAKICEAHRISADELKMILDELEKEHEKHARTLNKSLEETLNE